VTQGFGGNTKVTFPRALHELIVVVDYIIIIVADVDLDVNPNEAKDIRYVSLEELKGIFKQPDISTFLAVSDCLRAPIQTVVQIDLSSVFV
jgi:isopentenyldiphosphate isomerase